ncbi:hypothetical protein DNTS_024196 [Danionella cerebrum]|uniref:Fork-head domain-containing protein n=1 Tax=Danionella cerebrum TaxID=2873325 RepID=A0A553RIN8_9TELE|nr:hypothetical protein DNTS_024196 [Danionella translucida]
MNFQQHGYRGAKPRARAYPPSGGPMLFEDTSSAPPPVNNQNFYSSGYNMTEAPVGSQEPAVGNIFADPMASAAMMYGSSLANQGKDIVNKEINRFMSVNKLKHFFSVDTKYVMKKLLLLMFPYTHQDWEVRYHRDTPLTPRHDVNAPDLYIPTMAFITYVLLAGMALGIQKRMIFTVLCGMIFGRDGYFVAFAWSSCALMFFITPWEQERVPNPAFGCKCVDLYLTAGNQMEKNTQSLPPHSPLQSPQNPPEALSMSPSLPQPASFSSVISHLCPSSPRFCRSPTAEPEQDDLTCLSWLHQRGDLLPLQPLPKVTSLPQRSEVGVGFPQQLPSSSCKPPYSFSSLIFMAIEDSPEKRLPVKGIYEWIMENFPYFKDAGGGWRNSVRHNLSLSKSFQRINRDKSQSIGKGSLWRVCPDYRPALLEVLRKTHYCHRSHSSLLNKPVLLEEADNAHNPLSEAMEISDLESLSSNPPCSLTPDHEELVPLELSEVAGEDSEKDPLADSGYIELHYYQYQQYHYLVLPGDAELDLETVEILQLDAEAQEAAGSLLDLAGGNH